MLHPVDVDGRLVLLHTHHVPVEFTTLGTVPVPVTPRFFTDAAEQARAANVELIAMGTDGRAVGAAHAACDAHRAPGGLTRSHVLGCPARGEVPESG